ncbi:hypothetical protein KC19_VG252100 [Ceratodon purpureus]|uniref:Uncharacterized protein n=1 Tax=Ceratodon purpureus TaxID=3225 RepID=A0A8T0HTD2_CERPU|nr:hypothetical protein KC19_VG252100 [Ceratodon purpureus]
MLPPSTKLHQAPESASTLLLLSPSSNHRITIATQALGFSQIHFNEHQKISLSRMHLRRALNLPSTPILQVFLAGRASAEAQLLQSPHCSPFSAKSPQLSQAPNQPQEENRIEKNNTNEVTTSSRMQSSPQPTLMEQKKTEPPT